MGDFAWQAKRDPGAKVKRAAHRLHPLRMRSRQWVQVLGGKWAAILPKAELIWDLRLSLEMVSNLRPTILLHLVSRSEILIGSPPPFSHCPVQQKQFCQPVHTANLGDSPCRRQTDRRLCLAKDSLHFPLQARVPGDQFLVIQAWGFWHN